MQTGYLILALLNGTLGFMLWYALSSSLGLPKSFQIQYDINVSYFRRILRRRFAGFIIYGVLPLLLILKWNVLGEVDFPELGVSFEWNRKVIMWLAALLPITLIINLLSARSRETLVNYPEIRVTIWTPRLLFMSAFWWLMYLVAMEFLYRGLILQSLYMNTGSMWWTIIISACLYAMIHYFKDNRISVMSLPYGLIMAYATLDSGSLLPTIFVHVIGGLLTEWLAIRRHPEIKVQSKLYH
ncbi:MAG: lysostaphin resistance A-like protein [Lewinella sp.]